MAYSESSKKLGEMGHFVDFFHFRNHVDPDCHKNNNPRNCPGLLGVNTSVCEQTFSWLNEYKQTKEMNRARWMWFFTCFLDLHNLDLQGRLHETHPRYSKANQNQEIAKQWLAWQHCQGHCQAGCTGCTDYLF